MDSASDRPPVRATLPTEGGPTGQRRGRTQTVQGGEAAAWRCGSPSSRPSARAADCMSSSSACPTGPPSPTSSPPSRLLLGSTRVMCRSSTPTGARCLRPHRWVRHRCSREQSSAWPTRHHLAHAAPGLLELHVVGGPDSGSVFRLSPGTHRVGRAAEATVRVEDRGLSRVHAELQVTTAGVHVRDLGSTNGTWLDGSRLGSAPRSLAGQSHLSVGSSTLVLRTPFGQLAATTTRGWPILCVEPHPAWASASPPPGCASATSGSACTTATP